MNTRISTIGLGVFALTALVMTAPTAVAETVNLKASLKAADSVPPNTSNGTGGLQATYDTANKQLTYTVTYSGLTGNATAAHFHGPAEPGKTVMGARRLFAPRIQGHCRCRPLCADRRCFPALH